MFRGLRWRIVIPYVLLILLTMGALSLYLSRVTRNTALADLRESLLVQARAAAENVRPALQRDAEIATADPLADRWSELLAARVTIVDPEGVVLGDSAADPAEMENHLRRPEIQEARLDGQGSSIRFSETLQTEMMYAATTVMDGGDVLGYVRVALPLSRVEAPIAGQRSTIFSATLLAIVFAALLAVVIAERTARPVRRLTAVARRMAAGDLNARLLVHSHDEIGTLTAAFNDMGKQLREKVETLAEERGRLATVLELMADGVLITDDAGRVQLINPAAAELLATSEEEALGNSFAQVVRHYQLIELWQRCRASGEEQVEAVEIGLQDLFVQMVVTPLHEGQKDTLVILQNLTQIRRLQTVRRDFVSNISHELRTPLASLKAVVDTLRDSALDDPEAAAHFLDRADREVDALSQMVQELLELARIESGKVPLRLAPTPLAEVVQPPLERLRPQAERGELTLTVDLPPDLPLVLVDAERAQQVVANLVHNAIKFTPAGGAITISAHAEAGQVEVRVKDTGVGIPAVDLPRIFERFYKADRARSERGTGLGLAITRHLVQAHGGRVWAKSTEGKGSTFFFTLPLAESPAGDGVEEADAGRPRS